MLGAGTRPTLKGGGRGASARAGPSGGSGNPPGLHTACIHARLPPSPKQSWSLLFVSFIAKAIAAMQLSRGAGQAGQP